MSPALFKSAIFSALLAVLAFGFASPAAAQTQDTDIRPFANQLDGDAIKSVFADVTMDGAYNFSRNGQAQSFYTETHRPDGTLTYTEDGDAQPGRWFVRRNTLCFTYPTNRLTGGCFRVYQVKNCFYFYSSRLQLGADELDTNFWTARAVRMDETPNCEAAIS